MRDSLTAVDKTLAPGHGRVDLFGFVHETAAGGAAGAGVELAQRAGSHVTMFARGWIGQAWDRASRSTEGEVIAGLRGSW